MSQTSNTSFDENLTPSYTNHSCQPGTYCIHITPTPLSEKRSPLSRNATHQITHLALAALGVEALEALALALGHVGPAHGEIAETEPGLALVDAAGYDVGLADFQADAAHRVQAGRVEVPAPVQVLAVALVRQLQQGVVRERVRRWVRLAERLVVSLGGQFVIFIQARLEPKLFLKLRLTVTFKELFC